MNTLISTPNLWTLPVWAAETTLIAIGLATAAGLGSRSRRLGPSARHLLWLVVLVRLVMPPVVHWPWAMVPRMPEISPPPYCTDQPELPVAIEPPETPRPHLTDETVRVAPIITASFSGGPTIPAETEPYPTLDESEPTPLDSARFPTEAIPESWGLRQAGMFLLSAWLIGAFGAAVLQTKRILAFHRRLKSGATTPAPAWLVAEIAPIAQLLNVRPPSAWVVPGLSTPMLWCLGRPRLLVPRHLLAELEVSRWRGILVHELAHLRRGDHWVSRLELVAEIVWWWNPVYRLVRRRIDAEAELACDSWVVSLLPKERLTYADSLLLLCSKSSHRSPTATQAPALGVIGSGQFFEKRLTMILRDSVTCRASAWNALAAALLMLASAPGWTLATSPKTTSVESSELDPTFSTEPAETVEPKTPAPPASPVAPVIPASPIDPSAYTTTSPGGQTLKRGALASARTLRTQAKPESSREQEPAEEIREKAADDVEAKMEALADKMEAFAEKMEDFVEKSMGSDFERRMEAIGQDMEKKFGPGSDFEKAMNAIGKDMEKKFGPGSDFEKAMKPIVKDMVKQFGPGSDFEKAMKSQAENFKDDAAKAVQSAKSAVEIARQNKKFAEDLANEAKRRKDQDPFATTPDARDSDSDKVARTNRDKARSDADQVKARELRAHGEIERRAARTKANEARSLAAKQRDRDRKIKLLETKLQQLMSELKQLEREDDGQIR